MNYSVSTKVITSQSSVNKLNFADFEHKQTKSLSVQHSSSILEINLNAILHNYNILKSVCNTAQIYPVLKADAYGLGAIPIGAALHKAGCNSFFVAYIDEALMLRAHLPNVTIYLLNGPYDGDWPHACFSHNIIPVLNTYEAIQTWHAFAQSVESPLKTALHIDTGMRRLGLPNVELKRLLETELPYINWSLVMSHLACADEPENTMNEAQRLSFDALLQHFPNAKFSLANSPGIFLGKEYHYDIVRPGGSLYGHQPENISHSFMPCATVKSKILQIQQLSADETVGYGGSYTAQKPMLIATLALGYADGMSRALSDSNAYAIIDGQKAPFVGRVSMDLVTVDVTHITGVKLHDWATLIGGVDDAMTVNDVAQKIQTDSREVLVTLGDRFNKVYTI